MVEKLEKKLEYILKIKEIKKEKIKELRNKINKTKQMLEFFIPDIKLDEILYYLLLTEEEKNFNNNFIFDIKNIIKEDGYQENIGDIVEVKINEKKYFGIFIGSVANDYIIKKENNKIKILLNNYNALIFVPEFDKIYTSKEIWFKKIPEEKNIKIKEKIKKILKENYEQN